MSQQENSQFVPEIKKKTVDDPFVNKMYGKWKLLRRIGIGGVGFVYYAKNQDDGRIAAVKLLQEGFGSHPMVRARFKREAQITTKTLKHTNILKGYLMGEQGGVQYFVAEYIEGQTLEDLVIAKKKLEADHAVRLMKDILSGLGHTHEHKITHRDLKPANIMITPAGRAKVIDYGLARDDNTSVALTAVGHVMGTPAFMSPEQAKGQRGNHASDLYACGILLFVMLTGHRPFIGKTNEEIYKKQINDRTPAVRVFNRDVNPALENVIYRLMEKDPTKRYGSAEEAIRAMEEAFRSGSGGTKPVGATPNPTPKSSPSVSPTSSPAATGSTRGTRVQNRRDDFGGEAPLWPWVVGVLGVAVLIVVLLFVFAGGS